MRRFLIAVTLVLGAMVQPAVAQDMTPDEVKRLALEAILENPQIIMEAVAILQAREAEAQASQAMSRLDGMRDALESGTNAPVVGNPDGDVTIVEFFDYNCPYCKRAFEEVHALIGDDSGIRVVYREWPILSEASVYAARAALAAQRQGKYEEFHNALMSLPRASEAAVMKAARDLGLDVDRLIADMDLPDVKAHIEQSRQMADALGFNGTPSFVIGDELVPGFVDASTLADLVAQARARQN